VPLPVGNRDGELREDRRVDGAEARGREVLLDTSSVSAALLAVAQPASTSGTVVCGDRNALT
jgi:hypothetical protein